MNKIEIKGSSRMKGSPWFAYVWKVLRECCMTSQRTSKTTKTLLLNPKKICKTGKCQKFCFCLGFFFFPLEKSFKTIRSKIAYIRYANNTILTRAIHLVDKLLNNQI